jgi:cytochrome b561
MQEARYSGLAMALHWLIAILVIVNWLLPDQFEGLSPEEFMKAMAPHKAIGLIIFALVLVRIAWRLYKRPPPLAATLKPWERALAKTVHGLFYFLLLGMPVLGYVADSFGGSDVDMFGLFTIPRLAVQTNNHFAHQIYEVHGTLGTILMLLVALHILGSLKHQFVDKDGDLYRMLPWGKPKA